MSKKIINGVLLAAVAVASGAANASITGETLLNFNKGEPATPTVANPLVNGQSFVNPGMNFSAYSGFANNAPTTDGKCAGTGAAGCYYEDGLALGIVQDTSDAIAHLHRGGTTIGATQDTTLKYHSDSSGVYVRALDSTAFSLTSMGFSAPILPENPVYGANPTVDVDGIIQPDGTGVLGANEYWEILGYASALNPGLDTAADSGSWIAKQTVANGFSGTLALSSAFNNISAFWIHYHGYQQSPKDGYAFAVELDNIKVNAAVSAVPVPAAVWLFGSGLMGLLYSAKRKASSLVA